MDAACRKRVCGQRGKSGKVIKVLSVGNSFSQDAVEQYLHELGMEEGYNIVIGNLFIGGCSLERHVNNIRKDASAYDYRKSDWTGKSTS